MIDRGAEKRERDEGERSAVWYGAKLPTDYIANFVTWTSSRPWFSFSLPHTMLVYRYIYIYTYTYMQLSRWWKLLYFSILIFTHLFVYSLCFPSFLSFEKNEKDSKDILHNSVLLTWGVLGLPCCCCEKKHIHSSGENEWETELDALHSLSSLKANVLPQSSTF